MSEKYLNAALTPEERAEDLLGKMTIEEKINQIACRMVRPDASDINFENGMGQLAMMGGTSPQDLANSIQTIQKKVMESNRFGIPAIFHCEALSGPIFAGGLSYPTSFSLAATFTPEIVKEMCDNIRKQMRAVGVRQALSPVLDIARDMRFGRINETYGGDPTLVSAMSCAFVEGLQGQDYTNGVAATAKHFLGYSCTEGGLNMARTQIGSRELREVFAKPFEAVIRKANIFSVMNSYSEYDGRPICASKEILKDLLRDDLGFKGLVVSDYMSVDRLIKSFRVATDITDAAIQCLENGLDVELPNQSGYNENLVKAVKDGRLSQQAIDIAAKRSLTLKFRLGLFENPYPLTEQEIEAAFDNTENNKKSLQAARKAMTLMKNDGVLPVQNKGLKVAVIGPFGNNLRRMWAGYTSAAMMEIATAGNMQDMAGVEVIEGGEEIGGSMFGAKMEHPEILEPMMRAVYSQAKTIFEALSEHFADITFVEGCDYKNAEKTDFAAAEKAAKEADIVFVTVGGKNGWGRHCNKGEGVDSASILLPAAQEQLLQVVGETNKNFVVVHTDVYPLVSPYAYKNARAILEGWLCGTYAGQAIAETLVGQNIPGGKVPMDVPFDDGISPVYHYQNNASHYKTSPVLGGGQPYVDKMGHIARPFGYGLSYTTFAYDNLQLTASADEVPQLTVSVKVTNTGKVCGDETVQLYGQDVIASVVRPYQELLGFKRITLQPDETKTVVFTFGLDQMAFLNQDKDWVIEAGEYCFFAGANANAEENNASYTLEKTQLIDYTTRGFFAATQVQ